MKKNKVLVGALSITLLTNTILPATNIATKSNTPIASVAYAASNSNESQEAVEKINYLKELTTSLENISGGLGGKQVSWLKELNHAADLMTKIVKSGINSASELRNKIIPRIDLLINVAETITADATELADSEQQAHIIVGFSVTRAILKATDLFENAEGLTKASENLTASLEKARQVPKLTEDSKRTHYTLQKLDKALANAKQIRNRELKNKLDPAELADVDLLIKEAQEVRRDASAKVSEVNAITEKLNAKIDEAVKAIPEGERAANKIQKRGLEKDIQAAKNLRDFSLKGKVESSVIRELNREITIATRVLNSKKSTLNEVEAADKAIVEAMNNALSKAEETETIDEKIPTEETAPEVEENIDIENESTDEIESETEIESDDKESEAIEDTEAIDEINQIEE